MDILTLLRMYPFEYTRKAADEIEELRLYVRDMEAARDAALRLNVERQPELGRIADALCEYNESDAQDAARYRWLRACNGGSIGITTFSTDPNLERVLVETEADAAIDAAMALTHNV